MIGLFWMWLADAQAYSVDWSHVPSGNDLVWHMCSTVPSDLRDAITYAANRWDAGAGELTRGADFDFDRGSDRSNCEVDNHYNEVFFRSDAWFEAHGIENSAPAATFAGNGSWGNDSDIVIRYMPTTGHTWSDDFDSNLNSDEDPIMNIALHEFGHMAGFGHSSVSISVMSPSNYPERDCSETLRIMEDDYIALRSVYPDTSGGTNLMLSRYNGPAVTTIPGELLGEEWTYGIKYVESQWTLCGETLTAGASGPAAVRAIIHTTGSPVTATVWWWASTAADCVSAAQHSLAERSYSMSPTDLTVTTVQPLFWDTRGVPPGFYYLCAEIDPDDSVSETEETTDNRIRSEAVLHVEDCD